VQHSELALVFILNYRLQLTENCKLCSTTEKVTQGSLVRSFVELDDRLLT